MNSLLKYFFSAIAFIAFSHTNAQIKFDDYFENKTLRMDYIQAGNAQEQHIYFQQYKEEPYWGGSLKNLLDDFNFGDFMLVVQDSATQQEIYSRGYSSLFWEWQDTEEARLISRSYYESVVMPYPKKTIKIVLMRRDTKHVFRPFFETFLNPKTNYFIQKDKQLAFETIELLNNGNHNQKLDVVILAEGYTKNQMAKFEKDCQRFVDYFFEVEPFKSNKKLVNFWAVKTISEESGTDIPGQNVWKNTFLNTHFYTFNSERYLTSSDVRNIRNAAAYVPYDQIYILVNTEKYGGGGIYNYYNLCSSDHPQSDKVFTHEFGHAFAALADEYAYGNTKASDLYDMTVEPWQVNITNLVDFDSKWKKLVDKNTPVPTPTSAEYRKKVGAFEGAGYTQQEIYRPTYDCKMRSNNTADFCPVCYDTVLKMLKFYAE